jgi:hypothetical protein
MRDISLEALERFQNVPERIAGERRQRIAISIQKAAEILRRKGIELPHERASFDAHVRDAQAKVEPVDPRSITPEVTEIGEIRRLHEARLAISAQPEQTYDMSPETVRNVNNEGVDDVQKAA